MSMTINTFLTEWKNKSVEDRKQYAIEIWYDWFCTDASLYTRTLKFIPVLKSLVKRNPAIGEMEVSGQNCCPLSGPTYDVMRIFYNDKFKGAMIFDSCHEDHRFTIMPIAGEDFGTDDKHEAIDMLYKEIFQENA